MATTAGVLAGLGSAGAQVYGAAQQGRDRDPNVQVIPAPAYATAMQKWMARVRAANALKSAPSMMDFAASNGTARFEFDHSQFTPGEAQKLGFTDANGGQIPYFDPSQQTALTPEQSLFVGEQRRIQRDLGQIKGATTLQERFANLKERDARFKKTLEGGSLQPQRERELRARYLDNAGKLYKAQQQLFGDEAYMNPEETETPRRNKKGIGSQLKKANQSKWAQIIDNGQTLGLKELFGF